MNERNLGVGTDVHDQGGGRAAPMLFGGEQCGHVIAADETADIRRQVNIGAGADRQVEFARLDVDVWSWGGVATGSRTVQQYSIEEV